MMMSNAEFAHEEAASSSEMAMAAGLRAEGHAGAGGGRIGARLVTPAAMDAFRELQKSLAGVAEELGLDTEDDVMELVREFRNADNA